MIDAIELRYAASWVWFQVRVGYWASMWWFGTPSSEIPPDVQYALEVGSIYDHGHGGDER